MFVKDKEALLQIKKGIDNFDWWAVRVGYDRLVEPVAEIFTLKDQDNIKSITASEFAELLVGSLITKLTEDNDTANGWTLVGPFEDIYSHRHGKVCFYMWISKGEDDIGTNLAYRIAQLSEEERSLIIQSTKNLAKLKGFTIKEQGV